MSVIIAGVCFILGIIFLEKREGIKEYLLLGGIFLFVSVLCEIMFNLYRYEISRRIFNQLLMCILLIIAYIDWKELQIPNIAVILILWIRLIFFVADAILLRSFRPGNLISMLMGMCFAGGIFLISRLFSKKGIGMGDVKLCAAVGFYMGLYNVIAMLLIALVSASLAGIAYVIIKKKDIKTELPFAPFVAWGVCLVYLLGF